jgi:excinuclease UvrABC nuclease subunit
VLRGESSGVLERASAHRDALGEQLRFEEAAEVRDRIRDVEQIVGVQQRLAAFADRNLVLVSADTRSDRVRLLLVRAGLLCEEVSVPARPTPSHVRHLLKRVFGAPARVQVDKDQLDDVLILDAWLRRHQADVVEVAVDPAEPDAAAPVLREAIVALVATHTGVADR